jgi:outer membrane protein OmpA-like peptidoglycan-associated protein
MRKNYAFWLLWGAALLGISGCGMSEAKQRGTIVGAALGAVAFGAGGAAVGSEFGDGDDDERGAAAGIGVAIGVLLGGTLGYLLTEESQAAPPPPPPPPPPAPRAATPPPASAPGEAKRIVLRGINFDFDKASIKQEFVPVLDEAAQILKDNPRVQVVVEGHTDSKGTDEYNLRLSERRAKAVKQYLVSRGVEASRLEAMGKGEKEPIADNMKNGKDNPEGRAMNRRAELKVK